MIYSCKDIVFRGVLKKDYAAVPVIFLLNSLVIGL
jgi:hypothetical protein